MPSDAYMELSSLSISGETYDEQFGQKTNYGMFEISGFEFDVGDDSADDSDKGQAGAGGKNGQSHSGAGHASAGKGQSSAHQETNKKTFKIKKGLDYASPDLFRRCVEKKPINWGVIVVREPGDASKTPFLTLEFRKLRVKSFSWDLDAAEGGEGAMKIESISFEFDTILIQYSQQKTDGSHAPPKTNRWNFAGQNGDVDALTDSEPADE